MKPYGKPAAASAGRMVEGDDLDAVVNDALGTVDPADSTGMDEDKETGDAKTENFPTRED